MLTKISLLSYLKNAYSSWNEIRQNIKAMKSWKTHGEIPEKLQTLSGIATFVLISEAIKKKAKGIIIKLNGETVLPSITLVFNDEETVAYPINFKSIEFIAQNLLFLCDDIILKKDEYHRGIMQRKTFLYHRDLDVKINCIMEYRFPTIEDIIKNAEVAANAFPTFEDAMENKGYFCEIALYENYKSKLKPNIEELEVQFVG